MAKTVFEEKLFADIASGSLPEKIGLTLHGFYTSHAKVLQKKNISPDKFTPLFLGYLENVKRQCETPFSFEPYHKKIRSPYDYYKFGNDFIDPLIDREKSTLNGKAQINKIDEYIEKKHNVVLFANHQTEADPQAISLMLEKDYPELAEEMIFVAGDRVVTDPLAIPFSMGRNLLCIYSKNYIDNPPEQKATKQQHNKITMQHMKNLLSEGGHCIYVAPSGGRDRTNKEGIVEIAAFDPKSIELFYLMTQKANLPTHFFPLALDTHTILPPPETIQIELGEERTTKGGAIHISFGSEIDMENFEGSDIKEKSERRIARATSIWKKVCSMY